MAIVAGLTPRPESRAALGRAVEEAERRGVALHVVRAMGDRLNENPSRTREWGEEVAAANAGLEELRTSLEERGIAVTLHVDPVDTDPASRILAVADEVGADLIVIGLRRRSPVGKLVLGSVSQDVILRADCAVLAVKAD